MKILSLSALDCCKEFFSKERPKLLLAAPPLTELGRRMPLLSSTGRNAAFLVGGRGTGARLPFDTLQQICLLTFSVNYSTFVL